MIQLVDKSLKAEVGDVLKILRNSLTNGKLSSIQLTSSGYKVPCPYHSDGKERHSSCYINNVGIWHCFTCGQKGLMSKFVGLCFDSTTKFGENWLLSRFEVESSLSLQDLPEINLNKTIRQENSLEEQLNSFQHYHPYMQKRKLSVQICEKFSIRYDPKSQCIVFPVWDEQNNLVMFTRRSVNNKTFLIDKDVVKPVYLLNFINKENIKEVVVCESQINALYAWSLGYPAIALFGTGTSEQYEILNRSGIRHYILCFDGDNAGRSGRERFIKNIRQDVLVDTLNVPLGKDLNDLSKEEVTKLFTELDNQIAL